MYQQFLDYRKSVKIFKGGVILNYFRGSEWRKWDLHVHTPSSLIQHYGGDTDEIWEKYILDLESLQREFKVIGINDYLFLDGYEKVLEYKNNGRLKNIDLVLPVLEFRIEKFAGVDFGNLKRINLHVIFSNELKFETIKSQFLNGLEQSYKLEKDGNEWNRAITKDSLIELGRKIKESVPTEELIKYKGDLEEGFNSLNINEKKIFKLLERDCFEGKYLISIGKTEWNALKWSNVNDLLLDCSDAHYFSNSNEKDKIGNCFTWIKSEPIFDGLKQIIYDPKSRIKILENAPLKPNNIIESITLNISEDSKICVKQKDGQEKEESFCFAGVKNTFYLSPFFNCFIGGRGVGKSTILSFLGQHSKNPNSSKIFWEKIQPLFDPSDQNIFSFDGVSMFEFIGQNEVERFATNKEAFTNAIYERANILSEGLLEKNEKKLSTLLNRIQSFQSLVEILDELVNEKASKEKEKKIIKNSIKVTKSLKYSAIVDQITKKSNQKQQLERWRTTINELRDSFNSLQKYHFTFDFKGNEKVIPEMERQEKSVALPYQKAYEKARVYIESVVKILDENKFKYLLEKEKRLSREIEKHEKELSQLLKKAGLSDENILQVKSAPQKLVRIEDELLKIKKKVEDKKEELCEYEDVLTEVKKVKVEYERVIGDRIKPLVTTLEKQAQENEKQDVKNIGLSYFFDEQKAWKEIADDFYKYFAENHRGSERADLLRSYIIENKKVFDDDHTKINEFLSKEVKKVGYIKFLKNVFSSSSNYQVFRTIKDKRLNDVVRYKRIQVLYDRKDIEKASFGQKCTAVMVILLLFGNYPLIIDEPEAHLDSSLIANYLVPLIKQKKNNRQIIFATHNANLVINGDSEKIFILKNETGITEIIETTIEDLKNRSELLKLEGGREAFRKRGEKLNI
jgi:energy-coupling factor transporter ATP-binding protein EcfA2